jgi:hypothetical protein
MKIGNIRIDHQQVMRHFLRFSRSSEKIFVFPAFRPSGNRGPQSGFPFLAGWRM